MTAQATYVRTDRIPLDQLTPFPGNAKRGNVEAIVESLRRNGQYRSLVVREIQNGPLIVLAGNHTMQAFTAHGPGNCGATVKAGRGSRPCGICANDPTWEPAPRCEVVTCDEDTARRVNIVDNRASDLGTYDFEALSDLLAGLDDLEGTGYSTRDVEDITALLTAPPDEAVPIMDHHGEPNEEVFRPKINMSVSPEMFDRWRLALDAHTGRDDEVKLGALLDEIDIAREQAAA
ncbi:ParB/Srx family N-terminal domain-containing protein [Streptomyces sp. H27-H5]|uniref:ParB/Srx family N-terminal domain-containing protein n=1 Tax=Streptomyces sp. H27-H5 TaxID=2996460 RepID=UPI00226F3A6B|nr:ParB/Srx family N-terminal domain-containing protein [Streptomyces sp. H27-H5]MCY0957717.1 ParB/Srx family N-terminal domain-containing protein [Streptomyces sp. H27-H5]